jgi:hypothetical protein
MNDKIQEEAADEMPRALPKPVVESLRAETLARLDAFRRDLAEASVEARDGVWRYRRTVAGESLPTLLLPGLQGGGDAF